MTADCRLLRLECSVIDDPLPADRHALAFADAAFAALKASIAEHGQHVPIIARPAASRAGRYELAAGRRRLRACRELGTAVLARVVALDDTGMLALQYRENAERADVSVFERGRWFLRLAQERGLSSTQIAALAGLSQPMVVDYQRLARLPEALIFQLDDPRELSLADGRRLTAALVEPGAIDRMLSALAAADQDLSTRAQVLLAVQAASRKPAVTAAAGGARPISDENGERLGVLTRSGSQWVCRFAPALDEDAVTFMADRLPALLAEWRRSRG